jgi:hypothetical protein
MCDASSSSDPDGQVLFYKWKMDSGAFVDGSSSYDQSGLTSGTSHTFTVQVTDTGGASSQQTSAAVTVP